jgi:hypothetical protein
MVHWTQGDQMSFAKNTPKIGAQSIVSQNLYTTGTVGKSGQFFFYFCNFQTTAQSKRQRPCQ